MRIEIPYTDENRQDIINSNERIILVEDQINADGKFLIFDDGDDKTLEREVIALKQTIADLRYELEVKKVITKNVLSS